MRWSGLVKFFLGIIFAIALLVAGGVVAGLYFIYQVTTPPPRPTFANDKTTTPPQSVASTSLKLAANTPAPPQKALAPGTYLARVNWSEGLSLRSEPSLDAERIGGIEYNQQIIVLEESKDKNWQRVRLEGGEQEGWIKAGNIERIEAEQ